MPSTSVIKEELLGSGAYGYVYAGRIVDASGNLCMRAAIKTLRVRVTDRLKNDLTREARIMYRYR